MASLLDVPMPVQYLIASYLHAWDICLLGTLCRKLRLVSQSDVVWRYLMRDSLPGPLKRRLFMKRRIVTKLIFSKCYTTYLLEGHSDMILNINTQDSKILTASKDCTIRQWDTSNKKSKIYSGHTNWVVHADYWDGGIVSCSSDKTVRTWSPEGDKVLKGHSSGISCMKKIDGSRIATGSHDFTVKIWDLKEKIMLNSYRQFSSKVEGISVYENYLGSYASMDSNFVIRDMVSGDIVISQTSTGTNAINRQHAGLASILLTRNRVITGESTGIKIWDTREKLGNRPAEEFKLNEQFRRANTVPNPDLDSSLKHRYIPVKVDGARGVFDTKLIPESNVLIAGVYGLCGLLGFDLRAREQLYYVKTHDYPLITMDKGEGVLQYFAITSGTTVNYRYDVTVYNLANPSESHINYVPGHRAMITSLKLGENFIVSGARDGSVKALMFDKTYKQLRNSNNSIRMKSL